MKSAYRPVSIRTSLSFDDYESMQCWDHKLFAQRTHIPPAWTLNNSSLKEVLVRYMECRARFYRPGNGTQEERLDRAQRTILSNIPRLQLRMDRFCREYVALKRAGLHLARQRRLESMIRGIDSEILMSGRGASVPVAIIYFYFRVGNNAHEIAKEIGISHGTVRQMIHRFKRTAAHIENGTARKPSLFYGNQHVRRSA